MSKRTGTVAIVVALFVGLGLAMAPVAFGMFSRAPEGGVMIDEFEPYMTQAEIDGFRAYLAEIDAADVEANAELRAALIDSGAMPSEEYDTKLGGVATLHETWPDIEADMNDLLDRMEANLDNYQAVAALPPFPLFPWFFVIPGVLIAAASGWALWARRSGRSARAPLWALVILGVGVATAPAMFQMFTRAPEGAAMIDDFRPMMTRQRVQAVQGYFVTMGMAEGQLRTVAIPLAEDSGIDTDGFGAIATFSEDWPTIVADFNPMVGTMSDNVDNFGAVDAMPPFDLFPWFFLVPGLIVLGSGVIALWAHRSTEPTQQGDEQ